MIGYAGLRPGRGFQPGRAALYYAQRLAVRPSIRRSIARTIASAIRLQHGDGVAVEDDVNHDDIRTLEADGLVRLADTVVGSECAERLLNYFRSQRVSIHGKSVAVEEISAGEPMVPYPLSIVLANVDVRGILTSPLVLDIAARYLGCRPTLSSLGVRWSFPTTKAADVTQRFHRDPDDWRFLKLFVYLTDVTPNSGPHVYVKRSHRTAGQLRSRFFAPEDLRSDYGTESLEEITGPRGTTFIADTYGIHAGMIPQEAPRLILQAQYSVLPVFAFRYEPIEINDWADCPDQYVLRLLVSFTDRRSNKTLTASGS